MQWLPRSDSCAAAFIVLQSQRLVKLYATIYLAALDTPIDMLASLLCTKRETKSIDPMLPLPMLCDSQPATNKAG
jgi:hypothetical protein